MLKNISSSSRRISMLLIVVAVVVGLFVDKITQEQFMQVALLVLGFYFNTSRKDGDSGQTTGQA